MGTIKRKAPPRKANHARKKREFARAYHSRKRVLFVKGLPCSACGIGGFSENAHVPPKGEAGTGYKADAKWIAPLCATYAVYRGGYARSAHLGCHKLYDRYRSIFDKRFPGIDLEKCAEETERAWQHHLSEKESFS